MSKYWTYLIYVILWQGGVWGGTYYAVFILNESGEWFVLAFILGISAYSPSQWIYGIEAKEVDPVEDKL
jgi:hypothetical protein